MNFEKYFESAIRKIAGKEPIDEETFEERLNVYLQLINNGMRPATAKKVMDIYMEPN